LRAGWRRFWEAAPRQLAFTRSGRVLVALAFATGFAAINTGNNLLFLGWGLVLSAIVLSGVLSESVIKNLVVSAGPLPQVRAGELTQLCLRLTNNSRRTPGYAAEVTADVVSPVGELEVAAPGELRLEPGSVRELRAPFVPTRRGRHELRSLRVRTSYPFGFFEKGRRFVPEADAFWVMPPVVPVDELLQQVETATGEAPARRPGPGDDFFALRPFRVGDDPRRIAHRRSARTGRWVVRESEAAVGGAVLLELVLPRASTPDDGAAADDARELAIAALGSLVEVLLARGRSVGVIAPGLFLPAEAGDGQRWRVLMGLARLDPGAPRPRAHEASAVRVTLAPGGAAGLTVTAAFGPHGARPHVGARA
jgi:uncharacterized protein (DUF58 family)